MSDCAWCGESNLTEYAHPNAKDICVFCIENALEPEPQDIP